MPPSIKSVAIVGAGASGAAAVTALAAENHFDVIKVFERREEPGGTWIYDPIPPKFDLVPGALPPDIDPPLTPPEAFPATTKHSTQERYTITPIYEDLTTNVPEIAMSLSDRRFPYGPFVPHWVPKNYIREYFSLHGQDKRLVLNTTVEDISKIPDEARGKYNRWRLTLRKHDVARNVDEWWQEDFDAVIIGNGHYAVPYIPSVPGLPEYIKKFPGRVVHSKAYRTWRTFIGKRVIVIGNSASGHDVTEILLNSGRIVTPLYQSRRSPGRWDGEEPRKGLVWKPVISEYTPDGTVVFADGSTLGPHDIDIIVYSTGYKPSYPFWNAKANGRAFYSYDEERVLNTFQHTFLRDFPTVGVVGVPRTLTFRSFEYQTIALARLWTGRAQLPSEEEQKKWEDDRVSRKRLAGAKFHDVEWDSGDTDAYLNYLYSLGGLPKLDGTGRTPPILNAETRWALKHILKYPIPKKPGEDDEEKDEHSNHDADEKDAATPEEERSQWVVVDSHKRPEVYPHKDSLTFI